MPEKPIMIRQVHSFVLLLLSGSILCCTAVGTPQSKQSKGGDALVLSEYGVLSFADPGDGNIIEVPVKHWVERPQVVNSGPIVIVLTKNETNSPVFRKLTSDEIVINDYPVPRVPRELINDFAISPAGDRLLLSLTLIGSKQEFIRVHPLEGGEGEVLLAVDAVGIKDLRWSPDEKRIAFTRRAKPLSGSDRWDDAVCLMTLGGLETICLNKNLNKVTLIPAFSPDARYLAYFEREREQPQGPWTLYIQELSNLSILDSRVFVTNILPQRWHSLHQLQWSPDGKWLSWMEYLDDPFPRYFRVRPNGENLEEIVIHRPWWRRAWRAIWPLENAHRCCFSYQWWHPK